MHQNAHSARPFLEPKEARLNGPSFLSESSRLIVSATNETPPARSNRMTFFEGTKITTNF